MRRLPRWPALLAVLLAACGGGDSEPVATIEIDEGVFTVGDVESGQFEVSGCDGVECTTNRDGVFPALRSIVVTLEPRDAITDVEVLRDSELATGCDEGTVFVRDATTTYDCTASSAAAAAGDQPGGVVLVFGGDCEACEPGEFDGDLFLLVPGNDPVRLT